MKQSFDDEDHMQKNERRETTRTNGDGLFQFRKFENGKSSEQQVTVSMVDYSIAGLRFVTDEPLEKNTSLLVRLDLASLGDETGDWRVLWETGNADSLNIIGSVMWCLASKSDAKAYEVGMRFTGKASEQ